jgi:hypothetical protein
MCAMVTWKDVVALTLSSYIVMADAKALEGRNLEGKDRGLADVVD